jgi:hypothetical protein
LSDKANRFWVDRRYFVARRYWFGEMLKNDT